MKAFAKLALVKTLQGFNALDLITELRSDHRAGKVIGLVYVMNPGDDAIPKK